MFSGGLLFGDQVEFTEAVRLLVSGEGGNPDSAALGVCGADDVAVEEFTGFHTFFGKVFQGNRHIGNPPFVAAVDQGLSLEVPGFLDDTQVQVSFVFAVDVNTQLAERITTFFAEVEFPFIVDPDDVEMTEDLVIAVINECLRQVTELRNEKLPL